MSLLLKNARLIDWRGVLAENGHVLVRDGKISHIETGDTAPGSDVARVIDCGGLTLLPGFINGHVHLSMDSSVHPMNRLASQDSHAALLCAARNAREMLSAGFTTVRDCGGKSNEVLCLRDFISAGQMEGPRIIGCGQAILATGGHFTGRVADGPCDVRKAAREMVHIGADFIKVMATGGLGRPGEMPGAQEMFLDELTESARVAHAQNRRVAAHCHGAEGIADSLRAGIDSIEHGTFLSQTAAEMMAERGVFLVPTFAAYSIISDRGTDAGLAPYLVEPARQVLDAKMSRFAYALSAGVKIAYGTDAGSPLNPHTDVLTEAKQMQDAGMSSVDIVAALTVRCAELFGVETSVGCLMPGKEADLVLVEGNPLKDLTSLARVRMVLKHGKIAKNPVKEA